MIPDARKSWRRKILALLLLACIAFTPLTGQAARSSAHHAGGVAMKCLCGSAPQSFRALV